MTNAYWISLAMALSSSACAQQPSAADRAADQFLADDRQKPPSDPKLARDFAFLNTCSAKRIRASDINYGDPQEAITAKVHAAMQHCIDELYKDK